MKVGINNCQQWLYHKLSEVQMLENEVYIFVISNIYFFQAIVARLEAEMT